MRRIIIIIAALLMLAGEAWGADWYVRPVAGSYGAEDGSDYDNSFKGFAGITWGVGGVSAGDTLWICGIHSEQMSLNAAVSGIAGSPITIRMDHPSYPGQIAGGNVIDYGIFGAWGDGPDYYVLTGLSITDCTNKGIYAYQNENWIITGNTLWNNGTVLDGANSSNLGFGLCDNMLVTNNVLKQPGTSNITLRCTSSVTIQYNQLEDSYHSDIDVQRPVACSAHGADDVLISHNYISWPTTFAAASSGIFVGDDDNEIGGVSIFNNQIVGAPSDPTGGGYGIQLSTNAATVWVVNNTIYDPKKIGIVLDNSDGINRGPMYVVKNNIVAGLSGTSYAISNTAGVTNQTRDNNLYYTSAVGVNFVRDNGNYYTSATWAAYSGTTEVNSVFADPLFVSPIASNFKLQYTSPAINAGTNDRDGDGTDETWTDIRGVAVPQYGGTADIGAYEYTTAFIATLDAGVPASLGGVSGFKATLGN